MTNLTLLVENPMTYNVNGTFLGQNDTYTIRILGHNDTFGLEEEYDYDYHESVNRIPGTLVPVAAVYGVTLLLGVVGNILVIASILRYKRMQNITNIFLTSLASADLLLVLLCVPIKVS